MNKQNSKLVAIAIDTTKLGDKLAQLPAPKPQGRYV